MLVLLKKPSAWAPITLAAIVLLIFLGSFILFGIPHPQADEEIAAHLFQLWLVAEALMVGFFALKWLPQQPKQAAIILGLQAMTILLACSPVFLFNL